MKKALAFVIIAVMLLATLGAGAEELPFTFRNGVQWEMTPEEVIQAEGVEPDVSAEMDSGYFINLYNDVTVSNYSATLEYVFLNDALKLAVYDFIADVTAKDFKYLSDALSSVYGEQQPSEPETVYDILDTIVPGAYDLDALTDCAVWPLDEDTDIYIFYYTETQFVVLYANRDYKTTHYNIFGL